MCGSHGSSHALALHRTSPRTPAQLLRLVVVVVVVEEEGASSYKSISDAPPAVRRTQTASSLGYVWIAPGCSHYECSREDRSKLTVRQCGSCGCRSELSVRRGRQSRRDQQTSVIIVPPPCARRYFGHRPWWQSNVISAISKATRCVIGSQCNVSQYTVW